VVGVQGFAGEISEAQRRESRKSNPSKTMREIVEEITETRQQCSTTICRGFLDEMREVAFDLISNGKFAKLYLELLREPPHGKAKSSYRASEMATMEYLRGMC